MKRVLVVDDDRLVLQSVRRILESEGFEVYCASSSDSALEFIEKKDVDLFLIDIKMPRKDGIFLMGELKRKRPDIPIIGMSGYLTEETIEESKAMGAALFVPKPFTPEELLEALKKIFKEG